MNVNIPNSVFTIVFDASEKTITISGLGNSVSAKIIHVRNVTDDIVIYNGNDLSGAQTRNVEADTLVLVLDYDTTGMSDGDTINATLTGDPKDLIFQLLDKK